MYYNITQQLVNVGRLSLGRWCTWRFLKGCHFWLRQ